MVLKVLNCEIDFQDFEKVLTLAKMYIKYEKSIFSHLFVQILFFTADNSSVGAMVLFYALCSMSKIFKK